MDAQLTLGWQFSFHNHRQKKNTVGASTTLCNKIAKSYKVNGHLFLMFFFNTGLLTVNEFISTMRAHPKKKKYWAYKKMASAYSWVLFSVS